MVESEFFIMQIFISNKFANVQEENEEGYTPDENTVPSQFSIDPVEGVIPVSGEQVITVLFNAAKAQMYEFTLQIDMKDVENNTLQ